MLIYLDAQEQEQLQARMVTQVFRIVTASDFINTVAGWGLFVKCWENKDMKPFDQAKRAYGRYKRRRHRRRAKA